MSNFGDVKLLGSDGELIDAQNPLHVSNVSLHYTDIWVAESEMNNFSGAVTDLFDNLHSVISDTTSNNPKEIFVHFHRTVPTTVIGLGAFTGNFSNVKIIALTSGGVETTIIDESSSSTKYTSRQFDVDTVGFNGIKIQFHTADPVSISNLFIVETISTLSRIQGQKPDGTFVEFQATATGNFKISLEELESGISSNSNSQLNTTPFHADGTEGVLISGVNYESGKSGIDSATEVLQVIDYPHAEIHAGLHFFVKNWTDIASSSTYDILVVTPNTTKWPHLVFDFEFEAEANVIIYEGTTTSADGSSATSFNRNRNSATAATTLVYTGPTVTATGTQIAAYKAGSGKGAGGTVRASGEAIFKQNTKYLFRVTNDTTSNNWFDYIIDWYEHTNKN